MHYCYCLLLLHAFFALLYFYNVSSYSAIQPQCAINSVFSVQMSSRWRDDDLRPARRAVLDTGTQQFDDVFWCMMIESLEYQYHRPKAQFEMYAVWHWHPSSVQNGCDYTVE